MEDNSLTEVFLLMIVDLWFYAKIMVPKGQKAKNLNDFKLLGPLRKQIYKCYLEKQKIKTGLMQDVDRKLYRFERRFTGI